MRNLEIEELNLVSGGAGDTTCTPSDPVNDYMGIQNTQTVGDELVDLYEGVVQAVSHVIERVADAID